MAIWLRRGKERCSRRIEATVRVSPFAILVLSSVSCAGQFEASFELTTGAEVEHSTSEPSHDAAQLVDVLARETDTCVRYDDGTAHCFGNLDDGRNLYFPGIAERFECQRRLGWEEEDNCTMPVVSIPEVWEESQASPIQPDEQIRNMYERVFPGQRLCAISKNRLLCSGYWEKDLSSPLQVGSFANAAEVLSFEAGRQLACAQLRGSVRCVRFETVPEDDPVHGLMPGRDRVVGVFTAYEGATETLSVGDSHACVLTRKHELYCWGSKRTGQLGNGVPGYRLKKFRSVPGVSKASQISAGSNHTCILSEGRVSCFGENRHGQLGGSTNKPWSHAPLAVTSLPKVLEISAGSNHTCARDEHGAVVCWGKVERSSTRTLAFDHPVTSLDSFGDTICGTLKNGSVACLDFSGKRFSRESPVILSPLKRSKTVSVLHSAVCSLSKLGNIRSSLGTEGTVECVPTDPRARASGTLHAPALRISTLSDVRSLRKNCAIEKTGRVRCFRFLPPDLDHPLQEQTKEETWEVKALFQADSIWSPDPLIVCGTSKTTKFGCARVVSKAGNTLKTGRFSKSHAPLARAARKNAPISGLAWGEKHQCFIGHDGKVFCSGELEHGQAGQPPPSDYLPRAVKVELRRALRKYTCASSE